MTRLGYQHYGVTQAFATRHAGNLAGIHINMVTAPPDPETMNDLTEQEKGANSAM